MRRAILALVVTAVAACQPRDADAPTAPVDNPAQDVPPATAPGAPAQTSASPPVDGAGRLGAGCLDFRGFGEAAFGAEADALRKAWGEALEGQPQEPGGCHYLVPAGGPEVFRFGFMIEGGRFVRVDVDTADVTAPGGGRVGMPRTELLRLYPDAEAQPHKYVDGGQYLRIRDPQGGAGVLLFETDAQGRVTRWRLGVPPQIDYVEGCS